MTNVMGERVSTTVLILQAIGLVAPSPYTGPHVYLQPCCDPADGCNASPKLLAKQWLQAYQFAPAFVASLILLGSSSNMPLALITFGSSSSTTSLYAVAAVAIASIIPYTALYMEPGVNGAGQWKAHELLHDGFQLQGKSQGTDKDTARNTWKQWAEVVDMKTIAVLWAKANAWRYVITGIATLISTTATVVKDR